MIERLACESEERLPSLNGTRARPPLFISCPQTGHLSLIVPAVCHYRLQSLHLSMAHPVAERFKQPLAMRTSEILGPVSWRLMTVKWRQFSQSNRHSTIGTRQTEYHEALPSSANVQSHLTSSFADDGNTSWYSVCRVPMVERRSDCENCRHLTVVGFHDTGPWCCITWFVLLQT